MSRITLNSKCRLCRAEGCKLYLKGVRCNSAKCPLEKKGAVPPGMHGVKRMKKPSDYSIQLRAKQKAKRIYGINETQFKNYYLKAKNMKGLVGQNLLTLVELRLDNVVYLSGLASSHSNSRQIISHKHVLVNDKIINISSYSVKIGDIISLDSKTLDSIKEDIETRVKDLKIPSWLEFNKNQFTVKIATLPEVEDLQNGIDINLIIEYYSR